MSQIYMSHSALRNHCCHHLKGIILNDTIASSQLAIGIIFFLQTVLGIWGNFSLLYHYLFLYHTQCRLRVTDLIGKHLTIANILLILSKGVPQTITVLRFKHFKALLIQFCSSYGIPLLTLPNFPPHKKVKFLTFSFLLALNFFKQSTVSCLCIMEATVERCWKRRKS